MAPSAIDGPAASAPAAKTYPPAKIFPVKETKFESFVEPRSDGYQKALGQRDSAAIVIDNGKPRTSTTIFNQIQADA